MTYIEFLKATLEVIKRHDGKVFGKVFEKDLKKSINSKIYTSNFADLQYINLMNPNTESLRLDTDNHFRLHVGYGKNPINATRLALEIEKQIAYEIESQNKKESNLSKIDELESKFLQLKALIEELNELHFEVKDQLKKKHDIDFKTYYRG